MSYGIIHLQMNYCNYFGSVTDSLKHLGKKKSTLSIFNLQQVWKVNIMCTYYVICTHGILHSTYFSSYLQLKNVFCLFHLYFVLIGSREVGNKFQIKPTTLISLQNSRAGTGIE